MEERLNCRVAVVGAGYTAREHLRAFGHVSGVTLAGIHSRTRERAQELASSLGAERVCSSVSELYSSTEADLVVVCVSETATREICEQCFDYPWTVLLEKPPGLNRSESRSILTSMEEQRRSAYVALNRRFYSSTRLGLKALSEHAGTRYLHVQDQQDLNRDPGPHHSQQVRDNWMYANSIHVVDLLRVFGRGDVSSVKPVIRWNPGNPGPVLAVIEFESGDFGLYEGIWSGPGPWSAAISTSELRWEMRPLEEATLQLAGSRRREQIEPHPWDQEFKPGFRMQAEMAVRAALGMKSESVTLGDAVNTMELIAQIFESK